MNFSFYNQWRGIFDRPNWIDITLVNLEGELDHILGVFTLRFALFGFNFSFTWVTDEGKHSEMMHEVNEMMKQFDSNPEDFVEITSNGKESGTNEPV
jgi:hypothetical protein